MKYGDVRAGRKSLLMRDHFRGFEVVGSKINRALSGARLGDDSRLRARSTQPLGKSRVLTENGVA